MTRLKVNEYLTTGDITEVVLPNGELCIIDTEDIPKVKDKYWRKNGDYVASGKYNLLIHRVVLDLTDPKVYADHLFGNKLDNRKSQLKVTDNSGNMLNRQKLPTHNKSGYLGVVKHKTGKFEARITYLGKQKYLGTYDTAEEAAKVREEEFTKLKTTLK